VSGFPGTVHHGDELEHAGNAGWRGLPVRYYRTGSGYPGHVHHGDELEHAGQAPPAPAAAPALPGAKHHRDHGVRAFDPELESHDYTTIGKGRFCLVRTKSGRFYACIFVETKLGHVSIALHLEREAAQQLAVAQAQHAQDQHQAAHDMRTGVDFGDISGPIVDAVHQIDHVAVPVVHAVAQTANEVADGIDAAADSKGTADAVRAAARIIARAHLGDITARKFIRDAVRAARALEEQGQADGSPHKAVADNLSRGAQFVSEHVALPDMHDEGAAPAAAQSVHGLADPGRKLSTAVGALRAGDTRKLRSMATQELQESHGVTSLIPGVGSGVTAALGAADKLLHGGGASLEYVLRTAYRSIPVPPSLRGVTDQVLDAVIALSSGAITDAGLAVARDRVPAGVPRDVFDTLVNIIAKHHPIPSNPDALAAHYVAQYTRGINAAVNEGMPRHLSAAAVAALGKLPPLTTRFPSFVADLKTIAHVASAMRAAKPRGTHDDAAPSSASSSPAFRPLHMRIRPTHATGDLFGDIGHAFTQAVSTVEHVVTEAEHAVSQLEKILPENLLAKLNVPGLSGLAEMVNKFAPWTVLSKLATAATHGDLNGLLNVAKDELNALQTVSALVPGVGTGLSAAIGAAEGVLSGGNPIEIALRAAYGAIPIPPGIRDVTDTVLDAVIQLVKGGSISDAGITIIRDRIPSGFPQDVFDTLAQIVVRHHPIAQAAEALAEHEANKAIAGTATGAAPPHGHPHHVAIPAGLAASIHKHVPAKVAAILAKLPHPSQRYAPAPAHLKGVSGLVHKLPAHLARAVSANVAQLTAAAEQKRNETAAFKRAALAALVAQHQAAAQQAATALAQAFGRR
jgi:hypothetical protein